MPFSGRNWVLQFPTSSSVDDLQEPFRGKVRRFLAALQSANARVTIADTLRPPERIYLMYWSFHIANGSTNPAKVPLMNSVDIQWVHTDAEGNTDVAATKKAAADMVKAYGIVFPPAITSRHSEGLAIDMTIAWQGVLRINDASGAATVINSSPANGGNIELHRVGAGFGVIKLVTDPPHWSLDGH
jgi:D-alanyl-D-alanine dipeptidase